ncbi:PRC-barrel domain-containing protein [Actinoplanes xinjiangensis]|jgi:uncharacterized protein YrrD|uniref:PRC-barrel domain protein n=1 Tax=Actinoplanes xinjiangensis TaxID=512350 RepID=A0A316FBE1_9ACTN|nr:PRC-barrel domain-containing protein [Actinoplanes xinjiangensis]PWK46154.1 PRC-barrel domain protein [Actinoplanes xinjiangensis]
MTQHTAPEDLGAPVSYLVLKDGTAVYDRSGDEVGTVDHVLADEPANVFHGLLIKTGDGHRFAAGDQVDGLFEHGVIVAEPADRLATPSADTPAELAENRATGLKRAWEWLIQPK